ncbi:HAD superfamily hydrolase (TIGR01509 family) [Pseudomonas duriflava]|uniref:HAD superfamily hydrolase (TIGR01509 family) n=1 Tax=Pseudomonas duriflava TaxID=459528 RepID=A0A562Q926_9PSED|nr:HAD family phosphatase [Pseudomonas duriflava]TWI52680.1 HAD superfamily hydrolase (TIGR01509 family) [Pseudomonas duriflava]
MKFEALIFDCDGVLIDSEILVCRIAAEELTKLGYSITTEQVIQRFAGRPDYEMRAEIEQEWGQPIPAGYRDSVNQRTVESYATELKIMPGLLHALDQIKLPICVASSSFPEKLRLGLDTVGLYERFMPNVVSATLVARGKPEPDVFLFAAGWMKTSPLRSLVIEDSVAGVTAGIRAGMTVIGFAGGAHCDLAHGQRLLDAGASSVFCDMQELPSVIDAMQADQARA